MDVHVLCPFYRKYLLPTLIYYYEPMGIIWHPICDSVDIEPFKTINKDWIKPMLCEPLKKGEQCYAKYNYFIAKGEIIDQDYYGFICDDSMFEPQFFNNLKKQTTKIVMNSNYRGDSIPNDGTMPHGTEPLIIRCHNDVAMNHIGTGSFWVKGEILRQTKFDNYHSGGDGLYAENLRWKWPNDITYLPDWFVFGNFFQKGRHTRKEAFLKPDWELPKFINP
jgi:hypothetical protein